MVQTKLAVKTKEEEMMVIMAEEIQKEIDNEVMYTILVKSGWTPVKYTYNNANHAVDVNDWIYENGMTECCRYHGAYLFKNKQHAEWFILRWL